MFGVFGKLQHDGEKVQCHICGEYFVGLNKHTLMKHGVTVYEYREKFGLKRTEKLIGQAHKERLREINKERLAEYRLDPEIEAKRKKATTGQASGSKRQDVREAISRQSKKPENRKKIAEALKRKNVREKIAKSHMGKKASIETKQKMSTLTRERNLKMGQRHPSRRPEVRKKMSAGMKKYWDEHPELKKIWPELTKKRMAAAKKA